MPYDNCPVGDSRMPGLLPIPPVNPNVYLAGDGTWQPIEEPVVAHEELHTDNGDYDS